MFLTSFKKSLNPLIACLFLFSLFACQTQQPANPSKVIVEDLSLQNLTQQNKSIQLAIEQLSIGKTPEAESLIDQVLKINPSHPLATLLKKQLTQSYQVVFNTKRVVQYRIKKGDSLRSIAKQWLQDSIYFVSLAKLNNIVNPTQIQLQSFIVIPVIETSLLVKKEKQRSRANIALLTQYTNQKRFIKSLKRMNNLFILETDRQNLLVLQQKTLKELAESKVSVTERHEMIAKIQAISKQSKRQFLQENFETFVKRQQQLVFFDEFVLLFDAGSYLKSAEKLIRAKKAGLKTKPRSEHSSIEKKLIDKLHEKAILLRKNQRLQQAVNVWRMILEIQPNNQLAAKYYQRTSRLIERIKKL